MSESVDGKVRIERNTAREDYSETVESSDFTRTDDDDVQRAIDGLKDMPDDELRKVLNDEDFMEGLDVVDAWEGDEDRRGDSRRSRPKDREHRRISRDRRQREQRSSANRRRLRREERKREEVRRDPSKSTKDIERDKIRTKRDTENKILAEREKAIKHLLDSDNVVPPGTEAEAIQTITEKQNFDRGALRAARRSRERRKSLERHRPSPSRRRSPLKSNNDRRRSPIVMSPDRRRSPLATSSDRIRRFSAEKRWSDERPRRRIEGYERDLKFMGRRSRSRERHRSRSIERHRSRSIERHRRRSPIERRFSPRRRSRSRSKSLDRRGRKRSPFINEIARKFRDDAMIPSTSGNVGYLQPQSMGGIPPLLGGPMYQPDQQSGPPSSFMHQVGPPGLLGMPVGNGPPAFVNFDAQHPPTPLMSFDSMPVQPPDFASSSTMFDQPNRGPIQSLNIQPLLPLPVPSPQPVPAPGPPEKLSYSQPHLMPLMSSPNQTKPMDVAGGRSKTPQQAPHSHSFKDRGPKSSYNGYQFPQQERIKTPEPPVISDSKLFEKTSLSSLLEASVSAKDSTGPPVLYPGFKPEILRHCEHALRDLPIEDPRLRMKGRFFFNPKKEVSENGHDEKASNSVLLRKGRSKIPWEEEDESEQQTNAMKLNMNMHQKICQTDRIETDAKSFQVCPTMVDFGVQVFPYDIQQATKEEKKPIMDRLDWSMRETYDYTPKIHDADDLRWSLTNPTSKGRPWNRTLSPARGSSDDRNHGSIVEPVTPTDHMPRNFNLASPIRGRESISSHRSSVHDPFPREGYASSYRHAIEEHDEYLENRSENRSDHSRGESPMALEESDDEIAEREEYSRGSDWRGRSRSMRGKPVLSFKTRANIRGKSTVARPYRGGRGGYRGKF